MCPGGWKATSRVERGGGMRAFLHRDTLGLKKGGLERDYETKGALLVCSPWVAERWLGVQGSLHSGIEHSALGLWSAPFNVSYPVLFSTIILVL